MILGKTALLQINEVNEGLEKKKRIFFLLFLSGILPNFIYLGFVPGKYFRNTQNELTMFLNQVINLTDIFHRSKIHRESKMWSNVSNYIHVKNYHKSKI